MKIGPHTVPGDVHIMTILIRGGAVPPCPCVFVWCGMLSTRKHTVQHKDNILLLTRVQRVSFVAMPGLFMNKHYLPGFQIRCVGTAMIQSA